MKACQNVIVRPARRVTVTVSPDNVVSVKGPLGMLSQKVDSDITVTVEGNEVHVTRPTDQSTL